jgi:dipeptidyl aminopeptidase/acylaminoacyl peptidase
MEINRMIKRKKSSELKMILFACFIFCATLAFAQITDQTISFSTPKLDLVFQPPLRASFNSDHPLDIEVPQLNLAVNLFENYMQYLHKLQKIATNTSLHFIYAPGQSSESWNDNPNLIKLSDTGLNQILGKVNKFLSEKSTTDANYLLDNAATLLNIPDQFTRKECKMATNLQLANISTFIDSLEPDTEMAVCTSELIFSTRPHKTSNRIFMYSEKNEVCSASIILENSRKWYANLTPSNDGRYLAFTDDYQPMVMSVLKRKPEKLFPDRSTLLLSMQWSPAKPVIAGMVLDLNSQNRHFFVYDAEKKEKLVITGLKKLEPNYIYAWPYWSPDGKKIILTSGKQLHLIDLAQAKAYPAITSLPNAITELIWSADSSSFAVVETIGQTRSKTVFDDFDLRKSILHRFRLNKDYSVTEDHAQRVESRNTIKAVSFWTLDRVLYLEGRLVSKKLNTPFWDLSKTFSAFLTPPPSKSIAKERSDAVQKTDPTSLPLKYLYVFRNLDGKFTNVYDAGFAHTNHVYSDNFHNFWFIGLRKPEDMKIQDSTFNLRSSPFPFPEHNRVFFSEFSMQKMEKFVKFLQDYNLRVTRFSPDNRKVFFLANFCGPLNIWEGDFRDVIEGLSATNGN